MTRQQRRRQERVNELLDAAMAIALEEGLEKLTIARIAKKLDAAVGALYRYFPSKDALIAGMQNRAIEAFGRDLAAIFARADAELAELGGVGTLAGAVVVVPAYLADSDRNPARHRLIDGWVSSPSPLLSDEQARAVNETLAPLVRLVTDHIGRATAAGMLQNGNDDARAHVLWALMHGLDHFRKRDRLQPPALRVDRLQALGLQSLLMGWGAAENDANEAVDALTGLAHIWQPALA